MGSCYIAQGAQLCGDLEGWGGREAQEGGDIGTPTADSRCCTSETNTISFFFFKLYIFLLILQRDKICDIQVHQVCEEMDPLIYFLWASQIF